MSSLFYCIVGPRLYKIYADGTRQSRRYDPNIVEKYSSNALMAVKVLWTVAYYSAPMLSPFFFYKGYFTVDNSILVVRLSLGFVVVAAFSKVCQGLGRLQNQDYRKFIHKLFIQKDRDTVKLYDFDFLPWRIDFSYKEVSSDRKKQAAVPGKKGFFNLMRERASIYTFHEHVIGYLALNTFGWWMAYPGVLSIMQTMVWPMLVDGREKLITSHGGKRAKLLCANGNEIDTMFVDKRTAAEPFSKRNTLVVCCEGNAGFYEVGIMTTAMEAGYSALGWNHPGFAGSTGCPLPDDEKEAIDLVMQYAIEKLGFTPENIILYAWSIGGYPAVWAAKEYPEVKCLVLDATFDHILPLAMERMPSWAAGIVKTAVHTHLDLDIAGLLSTYTGPVRLIRRTNDEIITTISSPNPVMASNRGNDLLILFLSRRYPALANTETRQALRRWLADTGPVHWRTLANLYELDEGWATAMLQSYVESQGGGQLEFPTTLGDGWDSGMKCRMMLYLASRYMSDLKATHCTPLPPTMFCEPWRETMVVVTGDEDAVIVDHPDDDDDDVEKDEAE